MDLELTPEQKQWVEKIISLRKNDDAIHLMFLTAPEQMLKELGVPEADLKNVASALGIVLGGLH